MGVSWNKRTSKSSILIQFSIKDHPAMGVPLSCRSQNDTHASQRLANHIFDPWKVFDEKSVTFGYFQIWIIYHWFWSTSRIQTEKSIYIPLTPKLLLWIYQAVGSNLSYTWGYYSAWSQGSPTPDQRSAPGRPVEGQAADGRCSSSQ